MDFGIDSIRTAAKRLEGRVVRTPLLQSPQLDELAGARVLVKAECLQLTGAFKLRGALNKVLSLAPDEVARGVATYSAGNHGQAVAAAARLNGCPAVVVLPRTAPAIKVENCRWWGAETVLYDPRTQDRAEVLDRILQERGMTLVHPFDDHAVMAGQGTVGLEIMEDLHRDGRTADAVVVSCSGGGLASGVVEAVRATSPRTECCFVEPRGFDKMARSLRSGTPQAHRSVPHTVMDAIAGPVVGARPLAVLHRHHATGLTVDDDQALAAVAAAFRTLKVVLEPGGAAALAAVLSRQADFAGKTVVVIASGGNVDPAVYTRALADT